MEAKQEDIDTFKAWLMTKGLNAIPTSSIELSTMPLQAFKDARRYNPTLSRSRVSPLPMPGVTCTSETSGITGCTAACAQGTSRRPDGVEAPRRGRQGARKVGYRGC
jgi:hypothetical protein